MTPQMELPVGPRSTTSSNQKTMIAAAAQPTPTRNTPKGTFAGSDTTSVYVWTTSGVQR